MAESHNRGMKRSRAAYDRLAGGVMKADIRLAFLLRKPLQLPAGTIIRGVPATDTIARLPTSASGPEHLTGKLAKPSSIDRRVAVIEGGKSQTSIRVVG
jgi:hypothetical protein